MKRIDREPQETFFSAGLKPKKVAEKDKPKITPDYCRKISQEILQRILGVTNAFANKTGYFTIGFKGDALYWYQLMGNLSSIASNIPIDKDCQYIVFSEKVLVGQSQKDIEIMANMETIIHKRWLQLKNAWIITEGDLWIYLEDRVKRFPETSSLHLMERISHA